MKNFYLRYIVATTIITSALFASAQTTCSTIKEVKQCTSKTEVIYTGEATTTYYGPNGIMIMDTTGGIYLSSYDLSEMNGGKIKPNMVITNIRGKFNSADEFYMSNIQLKSNDVKSIIISKEQADFTILDLGLTELINNKDKYECLPVRLKNVTITNESFQNYTVVGNQRLMISSLYGLQLPSKATIEGFYGDDNNVKGFIIPTDKQISAQAYNSINELKQITGSNTTELELSDNALVCDVKKFGDTSIAYISQRNNYGEECGIAYKFAGTTLDIKAGDSISGMKGVFKLIETDASNKLLYGSSMTAKDGGASIKIINRNNTINQVKVDDLAYLDINSVVNKEALLVITPSGIIVKKTINGSERYCLETVVFGKTNNVIVDGIDFSKYLGQKIAVVGIVDAGILNPGIISVILRSDNDVKASEFHFASIEDMKKTGNPIATNTVYHLDNKVLVNYATSWTVQEEMAMYGMYIQDETGAMFVRSQTDMKVNTGDSISGISGSFLKNNNSGAYIEIHDAKLNVISKNNTVDANPEEVTIKDLSENRDEYYGKVLKLTGVRHGERIGGYAEDGPVYEKYIYQDSIYTMPYSFWDYTLYDISDIIGIFDDGGFAESFSFLPLSQAHISKNNTSDLDKNQINDCKLYINSDRIIKADNADAISIYDLHGRLIHHIEGNELNVSKLDKGIYIVKIFFNNINKTTKIIL